MSFHRAGKEKTQGQDLTSIKGRNPQGRKEKEEERRMFSDSSHKEKKVVTHSASCKTWSRPWEGLFGGEGAGQGESSVEEMGQRKETFGGKKKNRRGKNGPFKEHLSNAKGWTSGLSTSRVFESPSRKSS